MSPRDTRSKAAAAAKAKVGGGSAKPPVKSTRGKAKSAASAPGPSGSIQDEATAAPNMKEVLKQQYPHLSKKKLNEMLHNLNTAAEKDGVSEKDRRQIAKEKVSDTEKESEDDEGELVPSASKGKKKANVPSPPRPKPRPRKRKATETPEKEASDDEAAWSSLRRRRQDPAGNIRSCFDAYLAEVSPGRKSVVIPEVVIQSSPPVSRSKAPRQEEDLAASLGTKSAKQTQGVAKPPEKKTFLRLEDSDEENEDDDEEAGEGDEVEVEDEVEEGSGQGAGSPSRAGKGAARRTRRVKMESMSPIHVPDDSDDDGSEYKVSSHDREEDIDELDGDVDMDDEIVVKVKDKPQQKKKEKAQSKGKRKEPLKSFLHHAQQEFRVYLSLENAWPRVMKDGRMEKTEKPVEIMKMLMEKHERYKTERFLTAYNRAWADAVTHGRMIHYVAKVSSQLRQEVKQKAKRVVEKNFLAFKVPQHGSDGKKLSSAAHLEALVKFLKQDFAFHHGNLEMPDPMVDPSLWVANLDAPFHNEAVAEVAARQWWSGAHREAMRPENHARFDINKQPLSSNMIALVCSAIIVALDEAVKVNVTVSFDEKTYATEHDRLKVSIDNLRRCADPSDPSKYDEGCARFCKSMDETLASTIRRLAGISSTSVDDDDEAAEPSTVTRGIPTAAISRISKLWAPKNTGTKASDEPAAAASASGSGQAKEREGDAEAPSTA
ncbi:uncharacterized protein B0H18DRAFT_960774 [Fomitopsis serialis]|uniref:uncharacterized protein n=1 Tax=Fomitopsis serialis TaxID=139415 RepID=UPI00200838AD|nr:uncharacterized protein B0H18DRAFT_960774 [Neoantrodia serialis]KAH9912803.1 hypothetical protein B0H18DRAFT_960774 [Neoantrodia serialis]